MGLRDDVQSELSEAMRGDLADVVTSFSLVKTTKGPYNSQTDSYDETETLTSSKGIFGALGQSELADTDIKPSDERVIINGLDLEALPEVDDELRLSSKVYRIVKVKPVMGGDTQTIVWTLIVRERGG